MKRNIFTLIAAIYSIIYGIYLIAYFGDASSSIGGAIAGSLVAPHMVTVVLAAVFLLVGYCIRKAWAILTGAILISVSAALFPMYAMFVLIPIILAWIGYAKSKKTV